MMSLSRTLRSFATKGWGRMVASSNTRLCHGSIGDHKLLPEDAFSSLIPSSEIKMRQQRLIDTVVSAAAEGTSPTTKILMLIPSCRKSFMADTSVPVLHLKQNSEFIYLTGLTENDAVNCVLCIMTNGSKDHEICLFSPFPTDQEVQWEGPGVKNNPDLHQVVHSVRDIKSLESFIHSECKDRRVYLTRSGLMYDGQHVLPAAPQSCIPTVISPLSPFVDKMRVIKSVNEMKCMKRAAQMGGEALTKTMKMTPKLFEFNMKSLNVPLVNEGQISAMFDFEARMKGATKTGYPPVVAGSHRGTIIHYGSCNKFCQPEDWVLMDAGCEDANGYNSDITRCWKLSQTDPATPQDRLHHALHEALCEVHQHLLTYVQQNRSETSLDSLFQIMCALLGKLLIEFNVIPKSSSAADASRAAYKYCPHHVSHFLGLDIHDTPSVGRSILLQPGMCFTVEPGLYFRPSDDVKREFKGIGLRVEDDLLVNQVGEVEVMTRLCPWTINQESECKDQQS